ncbi:hypothetical protein ACHAPJ_006297 [Fusarium lateritium]
MTSCQTTLPGSWYTSKAIYGLERRAIFLKSWILLGAVTKWPTAGENYTTQLAEINYTIRRSSDDCKTTKIFDDSGVEIRGHLTPGGLLFMTLSDETASFEEFFPGLEDKISSVDFTNLPLRRPLKYVGNYNWKAMVDGYQECLHCAYAHPEFSKKYAPTTYKVINNHNYSQHLAGDENQKNDGLFFYLFPNSTLSIYGGGMTSWRVCPLEDPSHSIMEFDYYHTAPCGSEEFEEYYRFTRNVALEDIELCENTQGNLNVGIYTEGILNPKKENGVMYYQGQVLEMCSAQYEKDKSELESSGQPAVNPV